MHSQLREFLEKLETNGFAAPARAHARVTKSLWNQKEKEAARQAIGEHYGAPSTVVRPPPPLPKASQWARTITDAKPSPKKAPPPPARPQPKAPAKPAPKAPAKPSPKKKTRGMSDEAREKHRVYNREYARKRAAEARGEVYVPTKTGPTGRPRLPFPAPKDGPTAAEIQALADTLAPKPSKVPSMAEVQAVFDALGPSAYDLQEMAKATRHDLANVAMRVSILEHQAKGTTAANVEPIEVMRSLQSAMLAMGDATKTDAALMPELHRIGRSLARVCVHVAEAIAGPEHPPTKGRKKEEWKITPAPLPSEPPPPPEETVSLNFDDLDEGVPEAQAAE